MIRGTTPDYVLTLDGVDLSDKTVFVTIRQCSKRLTKSGDELSVAVDESGSTIAFSLTQQDTLLLDVGNASIQVRFIDADGVARATNIAQLTVDKVLLERVIEYADNPA